MGACVFTAAITVGKPDVVVRAGKPSTRVVDTGTCLRLALKAWDPRVTYGFCLL